MAKRKKRKTLLRKLRYAAIYCRVSTFDQSRGDYSSLADQEARLRRAAEDEGYEVFQVFREVASSANLDRDELRRMLGKLADVDVVFVTKLDRLSRSMHDWCRLNELFDEHNVALVSTTQKIDTTTPMGRFFRDLLMLFAQFEREMIAERTYEKMAEQARKGKWSGGHQILGYDVVDKKLIINDDEAKVVRDIFENYLELASISRTARWANLQGYHTKHVRYATGREVKSRKFKRADIQRILGNITYIGKIRFDEMEFDGEHDGIISLDVFTEVEKLLSAKKEKPRRGDQTQKDTLLLGLLRCAYCGRAYTSSFVNKKGKNGQTRRYYYYKCTTKSKSNATACPSADLKAEIIDEAFVAYFRQLAQLPDKLKAVLSAAESASKDGCKQLESDRAKLTSRLSKAERESLALVDRLTDPELQGITAIKNRLAELEHEQQRLKSSIADMTLRIRDRRDQSLSLEEVREAYENFDELWDELTFDERQYAIRLLVKEIELKFKKKEDEEVAGVRIEA